MPDEGINLSLVKIDCGDLPKAAIVLIEKISAALGALYLPKQIAQVAIAEGKAELIKTEYHIQATDLQRRAAQRALAEETKRQDNIERILAKALPDVKEKSNPAAIDEGWMENFLDKCRTISTEEMRVLWARILSGEANNPGTFSKRTVNFLEDVDTKDAEMFATLCSFSFQSDRTLPVIVGLDREIYRENGIHHSMLIHLESIGLLKYDSLSSGFVNGYSGRTNALLEYFGHYLIFEFTPGRERIPLGQVILTPMGKELARISGAHEIEGFFDFAFKYYDAAKRGWSVRAQY